METIDITSDMFTEEDSSTDNTELNITSDMFTDATNEDVAVEDTPVNDIGQINVSANKGLVNPKFEAIANLYEAKRATLENKKKLVSDSIVFSDNEKQLQLSKIDEEIAGLKIQMDKDVKDATDDTLFDKFSKGAEIGARTMVEPLVALATLSENVSNLMRDAVGIEKSNIFNNFAKENQEEIDRISAELGYDPDDIFTPENVSRFGTQLAETIVPFTKMGRASSVADDIISKASDLTKGVTTKTREALKENATNIGLVTTGSELMHKIGQGEEPVKATGEAVVTGVASGVTAKAIGYTMNLMKGKEGLVLERLKQNLHMSTAQEEGYYRNYATMVGKQSKDLTDGERATALVLANKDAEGILYNSLSRGDTSVIHSQFNTYAKQVSDELLNKFNSGNEVDVSKSMIEVNEAYKGVWRSFKEILNNNHQLDMVKLPKNIEVRSTLSRLARYTGDKKLQMQINSGEVSLPELLKAKQLLGDSIFGKNTKDLGVKETLKLGNDKKSYDEISKLFDDNIPEPLMESYTALKDITKVKANADILDLYKRFVNKGQNITQADLDDMTKSMMAKQEGSSYNSFINLIGENSTKANEVENILIKNIVTKNTKEGFTDFVKVVDNLENLNFRTPEGKALKGFLEEYKKVFRNVYDVELGQVGTATADVGLTTNPANAVAYALHRMWFNKATEFLGATQQQRNVYLLKTLPSVLNTKNMPKAYNLKEQRGAIELDRLTDSLKDISSRSPEAYEIGTTEGRYDSSQMIGKEGATRLGSQYMDNLDNAVREFTKEDIRDIWEETKWFYDDVDDRWKFHLSGDDVNIKLGRNDMIAGGNYKVSDVIDMPKIFEAYPEIANAKLTIKYDPENFTTLGHYVPATGEIMINTANAVMSKDKLIKSVKETLVHEIQHSIQGYEGFASGGSVESAGSFRNYLSLHGEVEARALTKGTGEYPGSLYGNEYLMQGLNRDVQNYRGVPAGSGKTKEPIAK